MNINCNHPKFIQETIPFNNISIEQRQEKMFLHVKPFLYMKGTTNNIKDDFYERVAFHVKVEIGNVLQIVNNIKQYGANLIINELLFYPKDKKKLDEIFEQYKEYGMRHYEEYKQIVKHYEEKNGNRYYDYHDINEETTDYWIVKGARDNGY